MSVGYADMHSGHGSLIWNRRFMYETVPSRIDSTGFVKRDWYVTPYSSCWYIRYSLRGNYIHDCGHKYLQVRKSIPIYRRLLTVSVPFRITGHYP